MGIFVRIRGAEGEVKFAYLLVGILVGVAVFALVRYIDQRNHGITIQLPKIEAR